MFIVIELALPLRQKKKFTAKGLIRGVVTWIIFGALLFGYLTNIGSNKDEKLQNQRVEPIATTPVDKDEAQCTQPHP